MSLPHQPSPKTVVISCGGTGGHLAPGIALAQELRARGHSTLLLVSRKTVDATLSSKYPDLRFEAAPGGAFSLHPVKFFKFLGSLFSSVRFFQKVLRREKPVAAVAFGGFTTGGLALAATLARVPLVLHEGNHIPGKAIRAFRPFARKVFAPNTFATGVIPLGFPLRPEFQARQRDAARDALGLPREGHLLVILGGSQGAKALSEWAATHAPALAANGWNILCQTGANTAPEADTLLPGPPSDGSENHKSLIINHKSSQRLYRTTPFCHSMADLLSAADLAVARAGAGTIAELQACHLPAVLVPYPHAADNHQQANALAAEALGGAITLPQEKLSELLPLVLASAPGSPRHQAWLEALHQPAENARERLADEVLSFTSPTTPTSFPVAALL